MKTMTIQEIKIGLILSGATVTGIARKENVSHSLVSQVLHGHRSTPRIRLAIAQAIGKQVSEVWANTKNTKQIKSILPEDKDIKQALRRQRPELPSHDEA